MRWTLWFTLLALMLTACEQGGQEALTLGDDETALPAVEQVPSPTAGETADPVTEGPAVAAPTLLPPEPPPAGAKREFRTDFDKHTVPYSEILSGGPPKDGIPAIDEPQFVSVRAADEWIGAQEPVVALQVGDEARAYPLQILTWHEIVNDTVGGLPLMVSFCPLCNTAIAFERTFEGQVLDFGTTGRLRYSNLIMYDRRTETWWQQATGDAIAGEFAGQRLTFYPASIIAWSDFKDTHPGGQVLSRETGYARDYGRNPYPGYDDINNSPFLYVGEATPGTLPAMARVVTVELGDEAVAYPYQVLQEIHVINDLVAGAPLAVFWSPGTASALDSASLASGRDVGAGVVFSRRLDGSPEPSSRAQAERLAEGDQTLVFYFENDQILDQQTGSAWNVFGQAISGPLEGAQLTPIVSVNHFWFSWAAFRPGTRVYEL